MLQRKTEKQTNQEEREFEGKKIFCLVRQKDNIEIYRPICKINLWS